MFSEQTEYKECKALTQTEPTYNRLSKHRAEWIIAQKRKEGRKEGTSFRTKTAATARPPYASVHTAAAAAATFMSKLNEEQSLV